MVTTKMQLENEQMDFSNRIIYISGKSDLLYNFDIDILEDLEVKNLLEYKVYV